MLKLVVKDTGKGISKEEQPHLFEAFSRADVSSNANIEGTGLGLAIVKSIVDSMNGTLGVESEYGVGSEFWVKLPLRYDSKKPLEADFMEKEIVADTAPAGSLFTAPDARILAVDDNQSNLTIVKLFLKRTGIKPDLCNNGKRALELCRQKQYDLILLDHMMPAPDGIETLHMIREDADSLNKETRAVVLTANAVAGSRQMYLQEGFVDYLTKPLDSGVLEQTVKNLLPADKVLEAESGAEDEENLEILEFPVAGEGASDAEKQQASSLKEKLTSIQGLDYDTAMRHCGGSEEMLEEILSDIVSECEDRCERMKQSVAHKDADAYRIDAHSIKSNMATLGLTELSKRAKEHEFAAKDQNLDFIQSDYEDFISSYAEICKKLKG
jgi:CheY-like chemotaxis protein/HPt (histidine-containing phosphotransfer) domain-containing protein